MDTQGTITDDQNITITMPDEVINQVATEKINANDSMTLQEQQIECDESGRIIKGIAQDTNKNGTAGRPCEYCKDKEEIQKITEAYFKRCYESKPQQIPFIEELALLLDHDDETITLWAKKKRKDIENDNEENSLEHPEFSALYRKLKTLQKLFLSKRILGRYNPSGAISLLKWHHGLIETEKQILAGEKNEPLEIVIVEDKTINTP